jgi:aminoglycoside phosphotransferase (APT) family kinase protein
LAGWLAARLRAEGPVTLTITVPQAHGFSARTMLLDADWRDATGRQRRQFVVRVAPATADAAYPRHRLAEQFRVLTALHRHTDVAVPQAHWYEPDPGPLGAPFLVCSYVPGRVPADFPSYHRAGWLLALAPQQRAEVWWSALAALVKVHRVDAAAVGLADLDPHVGLLAQLDAWEADLDFFACGDEPVIGAALAWLRANAPAEPGRAALQWGDARLGNIVYRAGTDAAALLDWEMAGLGSPLADLAWFVYLDRFLSEGIGAPRLLGLPDRGDTLDRYAELTGRPVSDLTPYEVWAGFRFALVTARVVRQLAGRGLGVDIPLHRNAVNLLRSVLDAAT